MYIKKAGKEAFTNNQLGTLIQWNNKIKLIKDKGLQRLELNKIESWLGLFGLTMDDIKKHL